MGCHWNQFLFNLVESMNVGDHWNQFLFKYLVESKNVGYHWNQFLFKYLVESFLFLLSVSISLSLSPSHTLSLSLYLSSGYLPLCPNFICRVQGGRIFGSPCNEAIHIRAKGGLIIFLFSIRA